jgi:hypothetical protein
MAWSEIRRANGSRRALLCTQRFVTPRVVATSSAVSSRSLGSGCAAALACETKRRVVSALCSAESADCSEASSTTRAGILSRGISDTLDGFATSEATECVSWPTRSACELLERVADAVRTLSSRGAGEGLRPALSQR